MTEVSNFVHEADTRQSCPGIRVVYHDTVGRTTNLRFTATCNSQLADLSPGWAPLHSALGQANYTCVPLSPSSMVYYRPSGWSFWLEK